ncbi:gliding motility-associated C-terminal domain-containing protein [Chitinophaga sedimenti]|uniref:gliding motility-associated C-terminal domain-containing protein n=1 Tax=Chitinophaga sedimenti TaxID=2033606 RepID=UPI002003F7F3|nr:gliding motility-associated C-terminal domain-containing protein [Chitinophaga sedimenti]MCK7554776.1 gliding motility-associated C-terminal domain-containing protein [Chitinophaga sedimenti]
MVSGAGDTDNGQFTIAGNVLRAATSFDYETKTSYTIRVRSTTNAGLWFEKAFTINITDVNETPTDITLSANTIAENNAIGANIGNLGSASPDPLATYTYTLVSGTGDTDNSQFAISGNTLQAAASFDYETKNSYSIRVRTTSNTGLIFEKTFTVNVTNVNEPPTDITLSANSIAENNAINANIGTLSSTAQDAGATFTYTLVSGAGDTDNSQFTIAGNVLRAAASFDYETKNSYTIRVRSTTNTGLSFEKAFTINVTNVNEPPTDIQLSANSTPENNAVGITIGNLTSTAPDAGATFTYSLVTGAGDADNSQFTISGNELKAAASFNYEVKNSFTIRVRSTTNAGLWFEKTFTINVTNVPEPPSNIILSNATIFENNALGALIGSLSAASDEPGATFTYSLAAGTGDTDNGQFTLTGVQLNAAAVFNYEVKNSYSIRVRATANNGLSFDKVFTITIGDVNEAPTLNVIADQSLCATSSTYTIALTGVTPGPETAQTLTYSVTSNNAALFSSLTADAGGVHLRFVTAATGAATITVTLTDNGGTANGGVNTFSRSFNVGVTTIAAPTITASAANPVSKGIDMTLTAAGGVSYVWDNALDIVSGQNSATLAIRPSQNATYRVTAYNGAGCSATAEYNVTITEDYKVDATNFMSPNGDGINDRFVIKNIDSYPANELKIFDRSGRMIYTKKGYRNEWDARLNGRAVEEGTYYYILDFGPGLPKVKGFITVVRDK